MHDTELSSETSAMQPRILLAVLASILSLHLPAAGQESFVGSFAEPRDGGNLDTTLSSFDGLAVTIVPRAHASEAVSGASRWRTMWFAVRGVAGKAPAFRLPLISPGSGKSILSGDLVSFQNIKMVWSYEPKPAKWNSFETYTRTGSSASTWVVEGRNSQPFTQDVVYVSINERAAVEDFYEWLEASVLTHPLVRPTPSEAAPGTFVIGYQSGAPAATACSRAVPDMPLFGFVVRDPAATPTKLVVLVSGQHPYEGQNKVALRAALDWILNSTTPEAKAYRSQYLTVVYPFVNPTGEMAGLWRGTAYAPSKDTNRNWGTSETVPSRNRGIDTVIVHKNAMKKDIAELGLGEPYAVFDYHQNYGDRPSTPDYVLHSTFSSSDAAPAARQAALTDFAPYFSRLQLATGIGDAPSDPTSSQTLRGYMVARGVKLPLTFERSVYNTLAQEVAFGVESVKALVDPRTVVTPTEPEPPAEEPASEEPPAQDPVSRTKAVLVQDDFSGGTFLNKRIPDGTAPAGAAWAVHSGVIKMAANTSVTTNTSGYATIDCSAADAEVSGTFSVISTYTGLVLRATDASNYLRFTLSGTGWMLQKTVAGKTSTLANGKMPVATGADHALTAVLSGPTITLSVDGAVVGSVDVPFNQHGTRHGLLSSGSGVRYWRDFAVREP